ncbi:MAG TPA: hypothetical protein VM260_24525 [Pirellula sp.]|nr:hypothetical protein [Pirellula sp.]
MARSRRRTSRRTIPQRAANLIALALPAPVQRVADTRIGSLLMLVGFPVMILFGLLNLTWVNGLPTFTFNRNKAAELRNVASQQINELEHQAVLQNWGQSTVDLLHAAQGPNHTHRSPVFPSTQPQVANQAYDWQQQQQQLYQRQVYEQQLRQQQLQQFPYPQYQPSSRPWPANAGQQSAQGNAPSTYGQYGQAQTQPYGYNTPPYNNGYGLPSANNDPQPYTNQGGQLGRY